MEKEAIQTVTETVHTKEYPEIKDRGLTAFLVMLFCGFLAGLIAMIYTGKATKLYAQVQESEIESVRDALYEKAVRKDKTAKAWIIVGISIPLAMIFIALLSVVLGA